MCALPPTSSDLQGADNRLFFAERSPQNSVLPISINVHTGQWCWQRKRRARLGATGACQTGLSLVEVIVATMIVGLMAVAALNSLGAATRSSESIGNRSVAAGLADELMSEIVQQPYSDPNQTPVFGREPGEPSTPRSEFDDVDDYDGWNQSPPQYPDGTVIPNRSDWRQRVTITQVNPSNPIQSVGTEQGAKQIRVTIEYRNRVLAERVVLRTNVE